VTRGSALAYDVLGGPSDPPGFLVAPGLHARILSPRTCSRRTAARARWIIARRTTRRSSARWGSGAGEMEVWSRRCSAT
jgi:hypothetical protein